MGGRALSPIEMTIDKACGFDRDSFVPPPQVTLRCPACKAEKQVALDKTDPPNTAIVETTCPKCMRAGDFEQVLYFDATGNQLECA